jgi:hypothetical protein
MNKNTAATAKTKAFQWTQSLKAGQNIGVYSGTKLLKSEVVSRRTLFGRIVCESGSIFLGDGSFYGSRARQASLYGPLEQWCQIRPME